MRGQTFIPDRRHCVRQKVHAPAFASFDGVTGGMILDLSEEGLAMQAPARVEARGRVHVQLDLSEPAGRIETTGYIAWADALGRAGVRFSELPEEARRRLDQWLSVNAEAPGHMAPKVSVGRVLAGWGAEKAADAADEHVAISLEAASASDSASMAWAAPAPGTVQYEFNPPSSDLNRTLRVIAEKACSLTRGSGAAIAILQKGAVVCRASVGTIAPALGAQLEVDKGFCGECFRTAKSLRCDDTTTDSRVNPDTCSEMRIRSIVAAPIRFERSPIGLVAVFGTNAFMFDEGDVAVAESLAHTVLLSMRNALATPPLQHYP